MGERIDNLIGRLNTTDPRDTPTFAEDVMAEAASALQGLQEENERLRGSYSAEPAAQGTTALGPEGVVLDWKPIETAPLCGVFLALNKKWDIRKCWRHKPSSRTDEILTWARNSKFPATHWTAFPDLRALSGQEAIGPSCRTNTPYEHKDLQARATREGGE